MSGRATHSSANTCLYSLSSILSLYRLIILWSEDGHRRHLPPPISLVESHRDVSYRIPTYLPTYLSTYHRVCQRKAAISRLLRSRCDLDKHAFRKPTVPDPTCLLIRSQRGDDLCVERLVIYVECIIAAINGHCIDIPQGIPEAFTHLSVG